LGHKQTCAPRKEMSALPPIATSIAYARCAAPATVHLLYLGRRPYISEMVLRSFGRGRPLNAPAAFIHPCQPIVVAQPPSGPGWAHELKHDGYRLQIHVRDGRVRLYTINGADWSKRYPLITEAAAKIDGSAILDAEVVWLDSDGAANFDALHSRVNDQNAVALAFDLMSIDGEDFRQEPYSERKGGATQSSQADPSRHSVRRARRGSR
jgi:ATP-dependent DNA ligase